MRKIIAFAVIALLLSGCGIFYKEPYIKVNYYDLNCKPQLKEGLNIIGIEVTVVRPYSEKMVFRISENHLEIDEYNRWADIPSSLVAKYLTIAFQKKTADLPRHELKVEILQFEADLSKASVKVMVHATVSGTSPIDRIYSQEVPVQKVTGESFAKGVETALAKIVDDMAKDIRGKQ